MAGKNNEEASGSGRPGCIDGCLKKKRHYGFLAVRDIMRRGIGFTYDQGDVIYRRFYYYRHGKQFVSAVGLNGFFLTCNNKNEQFF